MFCLLLVVLKLKVLGVEVFVGELKLNLFEDFVVFWVEVFVLLLKLLKGEFDGVWVVFIVKLKVDLEVNFVGVGVLKVFWEGCCDLNVFWVVWVLKGFWVVGWFNWVLKVFWVVCVLKLFCMVFWFCWELNVVGWFLVLFFLVVWLFCELKVIWYLVVLSLKVFWEFCCMLNVFVDGIVLNISGVEIVWFVCVDLKVFWLNGFCVGVLLSEFFKVVFVVDWFCCIEFVMDGMLVKLKLVLFCVVELNFFWVVLVMFLNIFVEFKLVDGNLFWVVVMSDVKGFWVSLEVIFLKVLVFWEEFEDKFFICLFLELFWVIFGLLIWFLVRVLKLKVVFIDVEELVEVWDIFDEEVVGKLNVIFFVEFWVVWKMEFVVDCLKFVLNWRLLGSVLFWIEFGNIIFWFVFVGFVRNEFLFSDVGEENINLFFFRFVVVEVSVVFVCNLFKFGFDGFVSFDRFEVLEELFFFVVDVVVVLNEVFWVLEKFVNDFDFVVCCDCNKFFNDVWGCLLVVLFVLLLVDWVIVEVNFFWVCCGFFVVKIGVIRFWVVVVIVFMVVVVGIRGILKRDVVVIDFVVDEIIFVFDNI